MANPFRIMGHLLLATCGLLAVAAVVREATGNHLLDLGQRTGVQCQTDRLLVGCEAQQSLQQLLLEVEAGTLLALLTNRTYLLPPLSEAMGPDVHTSDVLNLSLLRSCWPCLMDSQHIPEVYSEKHMEGSLVRAVKSWSPSLGSGADHPRTIDHVAAWATSAGAQSPILRVCGLSGLNVHSHELEQQFWGALHQPLLIGSQLLERSTRKTQRSQLTWRASRILNLPQCDDSIRRGGATRQ